MASAADRVWVLRASPGLVLPVPVLQAQVNEAEGFRKRGGTGRVSSVTLYVTSNDMSLVEVGFILPVLYLFQTKANDFKISCYQDDRTTVSRNPLANQWPLKTRQKLTRLIKSIIHEICVKSLYYAKLFTR